MDTIIHIEENSAIKMHVDEIIANKKEITGYREGKFIFLADSDKITVSQKKGMFFTHLYIGRLS